MIDYIQNIWGSNNIDDINAMYKIKNQREIY